VTWLHVCLLVVAGLSAGTVNAIAGGGTLLSFPALLLVGLSPVVANVTNTVAVWPGYLSGTLGYRAQVARDGPEHKDLAVIAAGGAVLGTVLLLTAPASVFHRLVPYLVLAATGLLAAQPWLSARVQVRRAGREPGGPWGLRVGMGLAATYGAYFGGGLGIVLLAILALGLRADLRRVNGLKTALSLLINTVALVGFAVFGPVDWLAVAIVAPASLVGGSLGAAFALRLDARTLRRVVVLFGCGVGVRLLTA
jgi:uncharacterized membrane protein YfcA